MTTPELTVDNVHANKYVKTSKYTYSGDVEKEYYIEYYYNITQNKALDPTMNFDLQVFDKNMNLLDESNGYVYTDIHENDDVISVTPDIFKKADTIQLTFNDGENLILFNTTIKITKSDDELIEVDDTPVPSHPHELTEREIIERDAEAWLEADYGETYVGLDDNGNPKVKKKRSSFLTK